MNHVQRFRMPFRGSDENFDNQRRMKLIFVFVDVFIDNDDDAFVDDWKNYDSDGGDDVFDDRNNNNNNNYDDDNNNNNNNNNDNNNDNEDYHNVRDDVWRSGY